VHSAPVIRARDGQLGRRRWRLQSECPVRTVGVVVLDICPKDLVGVRKSVIASELRVRRRRLSPR
jgi:hypothetical protein